MKKLAITFDDLPLNLNYTNYSKKQNTQLMFKIHENIAQALRIRNIPAIGFVNNFVAHTSDYNACYKTLKNWIDSGLTLGNHTYSHQSINNLTITEFKKEIDYGTIFPSLKSKTKYQFFRHPYLETGRLKSKKIAIDRYLFTKKLKIAPVTIDSQDWRFNSIYTNFPQKQSQITKEYLEVLAHKLKYYSKLSNELFGRDIPQILLLHISLLNAELIEQILDAIKKSNYDFIDLDTAIEDEVYNLEDYNPIDGLNWFFRWMYNKNKNYILSERPPEVIYLRKVNSFVLNKHDPSNKKLCKALLYYQQADLVEHIVIINIYIKKSLISHNLETKFQNLLTLEIALVIIYHFNINEYEKISRDKVKNIFIQNIETVLAKLKKKNYGLNNVDQISAYAEAECTDFLKAYTMKKSAKFKEFKHINELDKFV